MAEHKNLGETPNNPGGAGSSNRSTSSKIPARLVILSKDVENITGLSDRAARRLLQKIKEALGKLDFMFVTVNEFCLCTGIPEEDVKDFLR